MQNDVTRLHHAAQALCVDGVWGTIAGKIMCQNGHTLELWDVPWCHVTTVIVDLCNGEYICYTTLAAAELYWLPGPFLSIHDPPPYNRTCETQHQVHAALCLCQRVPIEYPSEVSPSDSIFIFHCRQEGVHIYNCKQH